MKKLFLPIVTAIVALSGCSEDFEVSAPYKDVTVVYGIFNRDDTAHYIRIQKAFLDENKSALSMAKESDSNFYSQLEVQLKEVTNGKVTNTFPVDRVDLNNEGFPKEPGTFFTAPSYAYKFKTTLSSGSRYRVVMTNKSSGKVDSAETSIINTDTSSGAGHFYILDFTKSNYELILTNTLASGKLILPITVPDNARIFEGWITFHYVEVNQATGTKTDKSLDWRFTSTSVAQGASRINLEVGVNDVYDFLIGAIGPAPANVTRYIDSSDVYVYAGSDELYTYQLIKLGQTGGLTGDQIKPNYTNVRGENVLGLLASRAMKIRYNVPFSPATIDSFRSRKVMIPLNIQGVSDH